MDINNYLRRINYFDTIRPNEKTLNSLHEQHVFHVPFENLDIYRHKIIDLELDQIYKKVVIHKRGGFCYELNSLFCALLCSLGFKSKIIAARIINDDGKIGPEYDHLSIYVETDKKYLLDVGFGDLFIKPLEIRKGIQSDGRNLFIIEPLNEQEYLLSMSSDSINFQKKYTFSLKTVNIQDFYDICLDKQTNPDSYFVKNTICTQATDSGRLTLFNNKLIEKRGKDKFETLINNESELIAALKTLFGIDLEE